MDKSSVNWQGTIPALTTPFDAQGRIDEPAFRANVELCLSYGVDGVLVGGCTGEFWALSLEERKRIAALCVETVRGRAVVLAGTGAISTAQTIELTQHAKAAGCNGAVILPPFFVMPTKDDLVAHYTAISDAVDLPICLYNIPSSAVNALTPDLVDRLADIERVVAIKESSGDFANFYKTIELAGDRLRVFMGPSSTLGLAAVSVGAVGFIDCFPLIWGQEAVEFFRAAKAGDLATAQRLQERGLRLTELTMRPGRNLYAATKAAMNMLGRPGGYPRPPLRPLAEPAVSELRRDLIEFGYDIRAAA